jgi:peptide deformylase
LIYPIYAYGHPVLKKKAEEVPKDYPKLKELVEDMYDTMHASHGVGLAAPQIGLSLRLFVTDGGPFEEDEVKDFREVFINPEILEEEGAPWKFNEGCLSIPSVREDVSRKEQIRIRYYDLDWKRHEKTISGLAARIIQHEYDHIEGTLFVDRISALRRRLLKTKLIDISKGHVDVNYKMKFYTK